MQYLNKYEYKNLTRQWKTIDNNCGTIAVASIDFKKESANHEVSSTLRARL